VHWGGTRTVLTSHYEAVCSGCAERTRKFSPTLVEKWVRLVLAGLGIDMGEEHGCILWNWTIWFLDRRSAKVLIAPGIYDTVKCMSNKAVRNYRHRRGASSHCFLTSLFWPLPRRQGCHIWIQCYALTVFCPRLHSLAQSEQVPLLLCLWVCWPVKLEPFSTEMHTTTPWFRSIYLYVVIRPGI